MTDFKVNDIVQGKWDKEIFLVTHITNAISIDSPNYRRFDIISTDDAFALFNVPMDNFELVISAQEYDRRRIGARS